MLGVVTDRDMIGRQKCIFSFTFPYLIFIKHYYLIHLLFSNVQVSKIQESPRESPKEAKISQEI